MDGGLRSASEATKCTSIVASVHTLLRLSFFLVVSNNCKMAAETASVVLRRIQASDVKALSLDPVDDATRAQSAAIIRDVVAGGEAKLLEIAVKFGDIKQGVYALALSHALPYTDEPAPQPHPLMHAQARSTSSAPMT